MITTILGTIIVGFIVGLIARAIKPGDDRMGLIMTTILGIAGAALARFVGAAFGLYGQYEAAGWVASVLGAIVLLLLVGVLRGSRTRRRP
ncbi:GlsB/YeaQ/YmgE family stress response membrane protein [Ramlibacter sp. AN1015]|uniref:GlsB/YeaQ/YmgE family stress response membrane protein n=1 Tax=Ramlibacter sp. AN1015 TaxID=3133428 RepID=UPI004040819B